MTDILGLIRKNREARGWTEYQLAERSGLPQSTISSWYKKGMTPSFSSLEKICEAFGLTLSQFFADAEDRLTLTPAQRALLDKLKVKPSTVNGILDRMEEKGLVERSVSGADARQRLVALTPAGREREEQAKQSFLEAEALIAKGLTEEETDTLRALLERVIHNLEEDRTLC